MNGGWIKIHRSIMDHWIFQDPFKLKWWITMLLEVNFTDRKVIIRNSLYVCKRGESIRSLRSWAKMFNTTPETVRHFFKLLQRDGMIIIKNIGVSTHLMICNYDTYQDSLDTKLTETDTLSNHQSGQNQCTNEEGNNTRIKKKERKSIKPPNLIEVKKYFDENGYSSEAATKAYTHYFLADWHDSQGNPVLNWKQKMHTVWFKPENKKKERMLA